MLEASIGHETLYFALNRQIRVGLWRGYSFSTYHFETALASLMSSHPAIILIPRIYIFREEIFAFLFLDFVLKYKYSYRFA